MNNVLSRNDKTPRVEDFEFSIVEAGFKPDLVRFWGISIESSFDNLNFNIDC